MIDSSRKCPSPLLGKHIISVNHIMYDELKLNKYYYIIIVYYERCQVNHGGLSNKESEELKQTQSLMRTVVILGHCARTQDHQRERETPSVKNLRRVILKLHHAARIKKFVLKRGTTTLDPGHVRGSPWK